MRAMDDSSWCEKKPRESVSEFYPILQPLGLMLLTLVVIGQQVLACARVVYDDEPRKCGRCTGNTIL